MKDRTGLQLGAATAEAFGVIGRNFWAFSLLAIGLGGFPSLVSEIARSMSRSNGYWGFVALLASLAGLFTQTVLQGTLIYGVVSDLDGVPAEMGDWLDVGRKTWLSLLGLAFLSALGIALGLILLIIPGIVLALRWSLAAPLVVMKKCGIREAMGKSAELTTGSQGSILLLYLIIWALMIGIDVIVTLITGTALGPSFRPVAHVIVNSIASVLFSLLGAVVAAVVFRRLRPGRHSLPAETVAEVFA